MDLVIPRGSQNGSYWQAGYTLPGWRIAGGTRTYDRLVEDRTGDSPIARLRQQSALDERVLLLEQAPLFSVLTVSDLQDLATKFHSVRYRRGEAIFREGEPAERQ